MLKNLAFAASSVCLLLGAILVSVGISKLDTDQTLAVLGGVALVSLGLTLFCVMLKNKWAWRQNYNKYRVDIHN